MVPLFSEGVDTPHQNTLDIMRLDRIRDAGRSSPSRNQPVARSGEPLKIGLLLHV